MKLRRVLRSKVVFLLMAVLLILIVWDYVCPLNLPKNNHLFARVVVDEQGRPLRAFADSNGVWRYPVSLNAVSPLYIEALLGYEDRWFWYHPGINPIALMRALAQNFYSGRIISGGSTISMQVARLLHPHGRSVAGKLKQILRTVQLEWHLDKKQILTMYLNIAPFGGTIEGVQAASFTYLNKSAEMLTHAEAALLAVLPQSPTRLRPDLHPRAASKARDKVLERLATLGVWSQQTSQQAKLESVSAFRRPAIQLAPLLAQRLLAQSNGQDAIKSTINGEMQQALQDYLGAYIQNLPKRSSAALLVVENHSMAVKAYVGTAEFANPKRFGHVDMVTAMRSPGSTLKPFLYALAIDDGLIHSQSLLSDVPRSTGAYRPANFNKGFSGPVSVRAALQQSLNIPAVDLLARYGSKRFVGQLANAGLSLSIPGGRPNLAVILGGAGASLEQLVASYSSLANRGQSGELIYLQKDLAKPKQQKYLMSAESAWIVHDILSGVSRPGSLHHLAPVKKRQAIAWKTGTSYGSRDAWAIAVSKTHTVGVWVGRPDGSAMPGHYGRLTAGPLLFAVVDHLRLPASPLAKPDQVTLRNICWPLGTLADDQAAVHCKQKHPAWLIKGSVPPTYHNADADSWQGNLYQYWINNNTGLRVSMHCRGDIEKRKRSVALWPKVLDPWLPKAKQRQQLIPRIDPICVGAQLNSVASLNITGIANHSVYRNAGESATVPSITLSSIGGSGKRYWYINGALKYTGAAGSVFTHSLSQKGWQQVLLTDDLGNVDKVDIKVL